MYKRFLASDPSEQWPAPVSTAVEYSGQQRQDRPSPPPPHHPRPGHASQACGGAQSESGDSDTGTLGSPWGGMKLPGWLFSRAGVGACVSVPEIDRELARTGLVGRLGMGEPQ